jgi:hypothetical protein
MLTCLDNQMPTRAVSHDLVPESMPLVEAVVQSQHITQRIYNLHESKINWIVHQWGLFPGSNLNVEVLLAASGSPSGMGVQQLSSMELAALWDVPILFSNSLNNEEKTMLLRALCTLAPAKVLFAGTYALLTTLFRGG